MSREDDEAAIEARALGKATMTDHDPLCVMHDNLGNGTCRCDLIGAVRADERSRIAEFLDSHGLENAAWFVRRVAERERQ